MLVIFNPTSGLHNPKYEVFQGRLIRHVESPDRMEVILQALRTVGIKPEANALTIPEEILQTIHTPDYLNYLKSVKRRKQHDGQFSFDTYTPFDPVTYQVAKQAASACYELALRLKTGEISLGYALVRPPGHHAQSAQMGGYCYINNAAVAAQVLTAKGKVAILDLDFHHGNGTQQLFYDQDQILYASIHADPAIKFPHTSGFTHETGQHGLNINRPLPLGTTNTEYAKVLSELLTKIREFNPKYLVISLGIDTHKADPIGGFRLTTPFYKVMGEMINSLNLPTLVIQEGGYNLAVLGPSVVNFLQGLDKTK